MIDPGCEEVLNFICDNLDENADSPRCKAIYSHIESCEKCAAYLDSMKKTIRLYRQYSPPELDGNTKKSLDENLKHLLP